MLAKHHVGATMKIGAFVFAFLIVISSSCIGPTESQVPDSTRSGANVAAYKLNGKIYIIRGKPNVLDATGVTFGFSYDRINKTYDILTITVTDDRDRYYLTMAVKFIPGKNEYAFVNPHRLEISPGEYRLPISEWALYEGFDASVPGQVNSFSTDSTHGGSLTITRYDDSLHILSGTFEFNGINRFGGAHIISEGWFDISEK
jgi:hypothetical protein